MNNIVQGISRFRCDVFPNQETLYRRLASHGQQPKALIISCADSRVVPELITQCGPGELFVCRNAGNIVPPLNNSQGGVSATIEYAVAVLGVRDVIVCGHSDCGAMKGLLHPEQLDAIPSVKAWLCHCSAALGVFQATYPPGLSPAAAAKALAQENVVAQLNHLRTHPSVAARMAAGALSLHGWFFDLGSGSIEALDATLNRFLPVEAEDDYPAALQTLPRGGALPASSAA